MNEKADGQLHAPSQNPDDGGPSRPAGFGDAPRFTVDKTKAKAGKKNEAVLGPFTIRDLTVFGSTLILFIASLIPMFAGRYNLWNLGSLFFLGLGVLLPLIVSALFAARRITPGTRIRIGSLSVDQFASVVASFALAFFFLAAAEDYAPIMVLALVGALGLFASTVVARLIPTFAGDFLNRAEAPAHVAAREAAAPVRKPRAPKDAKEPKEPKEPKAAKEATAPEEATAAKESAGSQVAGWAKRVTGGSKAAPTDAAPHSGSAAAPTGAAPASAPAPASAAAPVPAQAAAAPATQVSAVVPAAAPAPGSAAKPSVPSGAEQTQAAGAAPAAAAAEQTRSAGVPAAAGTSAPTTVNPQVRPQEPIGATVDPANRPDQHQAQPVHEAFWFAVAQPRTAVDEHTGAPAFVIEPGGWVLALEDRGREFLVQHTDGRVGVLRDLSNIERG